MDEEMSDANPIVGDTVVVYEEKNKAVEMVVIGRKWSRSRSRLMIAVLSVELGLTQMWSQRGIPAFEKFVKGYPE